MSCFPFGTLAEITQQIRSKNVSPVEIVELHLKRIEELERKLKAFVHLDSEGARRQARTAGNLVLRGAQLGSLHGVPLTMKSCVDVAGWPDSVQRKHRQVSVCRSPDRLGRACRCCKVFHFCRMGFAKTAMA